MYWGRGGLCVNQIQAHPLFIVLLQPASGNLQCSSGHLTGRIIRVYWLIHETPSLSAAPCHPHSWSNRAAVWEVTKPPAQTRRHQGCHKASFYLLLQDVRWLTPMSYSQNNQTISKNNLVLKISSRKNFYFSITKPVIIWAESIAIFNLCKNTMQGLQW